MSEFHGIREMRLYEGGCYRKVNGRNSAGMCRSVHTHTHTRARGRRHLKRPLQRTASQTHDAALSMEEAAEPEQGVPGITQLIWGQTEDTCAPPRRPEDYRAMPGLMRGGRLNILFCFFGGLGGRHVPRGRPIASLGVRRSAP